MKELHPVQQALLELLSVSSRHGLAPTFRELQLKLNVSSTSLIAHHLAGLEKKGFIKRNPRNPRDIHIKNADTKNKVINLNLYGLAQRGAKGSFLDDDPIDTLPIPSHLLSFPSSEAFLVKAKGNSMSPKINDGDLIVARKASFNDSSTMYVCVNDGEALVKKVSKDKNGNVILSSINSEFYPFLANKDNFHIVGEVKIIVSYYI